MRFSLLLTFLVSLNLSVFGKFAPPVNDELINAINITNTSAYCSGDAEFNNLEATSSNYNKALSWPAVGKDVWFKFTASKFDVNISVTGKINANDANTLVNPLVALYSFDATTGSISELPGTVATSNNVSSLYKGALSVGQVYYVRVSANNDATGTFKLCIDNYFPPIKPGQDCGTFSVLCTKETFTQLNVSGTGANNHESAGTCLGTESNSAWYMFKAAKPGDFTFVITPTVTTNDIDWIFYDLGVNGDCSKISAATAIRCASGSGVTCSPSYYKTGLSMTETDLTESSGCPPGQNGFVKYVELEQDHVYAILIDNFSSGNNGFTLEFDGTADFAGPTAEIDVQKINPCTDSQAYIFESKATNFASLKWSFGEGASLASANTAGPFTITYNTPGEKVVVLEAKGTNGCNVVTTQTFIVANTPAKPAITASKVNLCQGDVLKLSTPFLNLATYHWSGPNGYTSEVQNPEIPATGPEIIGTYKLYVQVGDCVSEVNSVDILSVDLKPEAEFSIVVNNKCEPDQTFSFVNTSKNYTKLTWDFGPDIKSQLATANDSKILTFASTGLKTITLTVETNNGCISTVNKDILVEIKPEKPEISMNQPLFCIKDVIRLSVPEQAGITYAWSGPNNYSATTNAIEIPITDFNQAGRYEVVLTSGTCSSDPASIIVPPIAKIPVANFYTDPTFNTKFAAPIPITFTNTSLYGDFFEWNFGDGLISTEQNPTHIFQSEGVFSITLTAFSKNGCSNSVTQGDLTIKKNASTFVPNAFSPNGDGINDELIIGITNLKKYCVQIYNRLGNQVFFTDNIFENWNGTFKGNPLPVGVYYYVILGTNIANNSVKYSGSVTLIR
ncbi:PKD domain-containing protein [Pedobacter soli]|uniref:Gliding motility-associated C-terminal domain-containing protein n=1 Tax=Pedobacter soli TaxID=390242 RepID=A0A1G6MZ84_9SPHI|nr:PKD domain-containing protein [Pedobacter soli]SDC60898.1 gliding motility-associated C-terminal domain-containing protein [Pedobacter soli]